MDNNYITQVCYEECEEKSISLKGAVRMQHLSLSKNQITKVSPDAFKDMQSLQSLDLSGNKIANLAKNTFNRVVQISKLNLADNVLATVPEDIGQIKYLTSL